MIRGRLNSLTEGSYNIVVGQKLADQLGLGLGDKINLFTPQVTTKPLGIFPQFRRFTVSGIFTAKSGFGFDIGIVYINMKDGVKLFPKGAHALHVKIKKIFIKHQWFRMSYKNYFRAAFLS